MKRLAFATLASAGYVDHAAGLYLNLRNMHPEISLVVGALDKTAVAAFSGHESDNLFCVDAERMWGAEFWSNMSCRMTLPERAFASKPALAEWVLSHHAEAVLLLDSDLLFLSRIDDILSHFDSSRILLVPARHPLRDWSKSHRFGLFSAGIIGLSAPALSAVRAWKALCFDSCTAMPLSNRYYEQSYLDMFVSLPGVTIVHDDGINVSQTILQRLAPRIDADGGWRVGRDVALRVYHASRSSDVEFPLYQEKQRLNTEGLARIGATERRSRGYLGRQSLMAKLLRSVRVGVALSRFALQVPRLATWLMETWRLLTVTDRPWAARLRARADKGRLFGELESAAQQPDGGARPS